ncbi:MAG TPA: CHRD domain-containing protein, partial [Pirellulales bacterium]|nr:CHRD domain-containing protein [Pirellulales bacterium]
NGNFTVSASHTYAEDGSYPVSVLVTENGVSQLLTTTLNGAQTPDNSLGTGTGTLFLSADQTTLTMSSTFSGLSGNATGAHLHNAPAGLNGPIATDVNGNNIAFANVPLATSGTLGPQSFTVNPAFVTQLFRGNVYENIHTATNPGGEIRGQFLSSNFAVGTASVAEDDIAVTAVPVNAAEGKSFTGPVATFTDPGAVQTFSTVPGNGDVNPYGVAIVPAGFPSTGVLQPGDTLIANFNNANNVQGTGTTIVRITPSGQESTFFTSSAAGLDTGLVVLKSGFVIVANVPNNGAGGLNPGSLQVLDANGKLVETISNPLLAEPWDLAVNDQGSTAQLFVSNVSGTTGPNGTVARVDLTMSPLPVGIPQVQDIVQIGSGYRTRLDMAGFVVGPGGLAYDATTGTLYVASQAEEVGGVETGTIFSIANANTTLIDNGKGTVVFADAVHLHGPIGLVLAPNGDLITANSDVVNADPNQPSELVEFTKTGQFVGQFSVDPNNGGAFGLAIGTVAGQYRLAAVDDNVPNVSFFDFQPTSPTVNTFSANVNWGDGTLSAGTITYGNGTFTVSGSHTYAEDGSNTFTVTATENGVTQLGAPASATGIATVAESAATLTAQPIHAAEGQQFSGQVAVLSDPGSTDPATDFSVAIDWGDGTVGAGNVSGANGSYTVSGNHTYAEDGHYTLHLAASESGVLPAPIATASATADVAEDDLAVKLLSPQVTENTPFNGAVATFSDPTAIAGDTFTATINWGDNTVTAGIVTGSAGSYTVSGSHTYIDEGNFPISVLVTENGVSQFFTTALSGMQQVPPSLATGTATLFLSADQTTLTMASTYAGLSGQPTAAHLHNAPAGQNGPVATDVNGNNLAFTNLPATISGSLGPQTFTVNAAFVTQLLEGNIYENIHTAAYPGGEVRGQFVPGSFAAGTLTVAEGDTIAATPINGLAFPLNTTFGNILATFTDATYPSNPVNDFTATVNWGDGSSSAATITALGNGNFMVTGNHAYTAQGNFSAAVTISDPGGTATTVNEAILVPTLTALLEPCDFNPATGLPSPGMQQLVVFGTPNDDNVQIALQTNKQGQLTYSVKIDSLDPPPHGQPPIHFQVDNVVVSGGLCKLVVFGLNGNDTIQVQSDNTNTPEWIFGGTGNDKIEVDDGNDVVVGGGGNNQIHGGDGRDLLSGGSGPSSINGAKQDSILVGGTTNFDYSTQTLAQVMAEWSSGDSFATRMAKLATYLNANTVQQVAGGDTVHSGNGNDWIFINGKIFTTNQPQNVTGDPLTLAGATITATAGTSFTGAVASFTSSNTAAVASDFMAVIDWGDGSVSIGTVTANGSGFNVVGSHTYAAAGADTLEITLQDVGGDEAAINATATVIPSSGTPPSTSSNAPPLTPLQAFVTSAFEDVLGRAVDPAALAAAVNALQGSESRLQFATSLTYSNEYLDDEISQAYQHFLGRAPDSQGLAFWLSSMRAGMTLEQMQSQFIGSPEYYQHSGGTDKAWVDHMYFDLLGRAPDSQGEAFWIHSLAQGVTRSAVALGFAASAEREGIIVQNDYETFLRRTPGQSEIDGWVNAFEHGLSNETVVAGLIASDEYFRLVGGQP